MLALAMGANLALAFAIELMMLAALGYWAFGAAPGGWLSWLAALAIVAVAIGLWAVWGAPTSATRLKMPLLLLFKIIMFGAGVLALWAAGQSALALWFAALVVLNLVLAGVWAQV